MRIPIRILPRFIISLPILLVAGLFLLSSCNSLIYRSNELADVTTSRGADQVYFEDSARVFFVDYVNPFPDKSLMWFASYIEGPVEIHVHSTSTDSLERIYRFDPQPMPVYTMAMREDGTRLVKCVLFVDGRPKCARLYLAWEPLPIPQWKTTYSIENY